MRWTKFIPSFPPIWSSLFGNVKTTVVGGLLRFDRILFYHCSNCNEEVFGREKNPRYLRQNISLDDQAERTFGGRATLLKPTSTLGQKNFWWPDKTFLGGEILVVCQTRGRPFSLKLVAVIASPTIMEWVRDKKWNGAIIAARNFTRRKSQALGGWGPFSWAIIFLFAVSKQFQRFSWSFYTPR